MLKKTYLVYLIFLLIFIVFGFSLLAVDIDPSVFGIFFFSGYFILGLAFGVVFRKRFLSGLVIAFSTTFLSWLVAFVLFWSFRGIAALVQVFSEGYQNVLVAGLYGVLAGWFRVQSNQNMALCSALSPASL
jgi:hypothetical protein